MTGGIGALLPSSLVSASCGLELVLSHPLALLHVIHQPFGIMEMRANFNRWVRRLIGKPNVPYRRGLPVRGRPASTDL